MLVNLAYELSIVVVVFFIIIHREIRYFQQFACPAVPPPL